jgi:hypothetical protein
MFVPVAHGQSVTDLQAQIAALLAQIQTLQSNLSAQTGGGSMMSASFTRDLTVGSTGSDVKALQQFLNGHGAQVSVSGAGSPGNESSYFGNATIDWRIDGRNVCSCAGIWSRRFDGV